MKAGLWKPFQRRCEPAAMGLVALGACSYVSLVACSGAGGDGNEGDGIAAVESDASATPTLEEFAANARTQLPDGEAYVIEGDILMNYDQMVRYYEGRFIGVTDKAVGLNVTQGGNTVWDKRPRNVIRYCLIGGWTTPTEVAVEDALGQAGRDWARYANVYFVHVANLDGNANCVTARVTDGSVDFLVTRSGSATSTGAYPGFTAANQLLQVGTTFPIGIARHELGHILGLAHEQNHSQETLGCSQDTYSGFYATGTTQTNFDLTDAWDSASIMQYTSGGNPSCGGGLVAGALITSLDGLGLRRLYGAPGAWSAAWSPPSLM